jgi:hypothetical protein
VASYVEQPEDRYRYVVIARATLHVTQRRSCRFRKDIAVGASTTELVNSCREVHHRECSLKRLRTRREGSKRSD